MVAKTARVRWRPVGGFEGLYEVSDHGDVRSLPRVIKRDVDYGNGEVILAGRILQRVFGSRYYRVRLYSGSGNYKTMGIGRLVADAFVPKKDPKHNVVRHRDDNTSNNHYKNLQWGTQYDNVQDRNRRGRTAKGENSGAAKLTEKQVLQIIKLCKTMRNKDVAIKFGISGPHVSRIKSGAKWAHLVRN